MILKHESYSFLDFFAGSGLVTEGVKPYFHTVWANDISEEKATVYLDNQDNSVFHLAPIQNFSGSQIPQAMVSWASFPCQDLSMAGKQEGIHGERSGLVWTWLRIIDEMPIKPPIVVAENVAGLTSTNNGQNYRELHEALASRGYLVGPIQLDAIEWLPQSRKRVFVVGVLCTIDLKGLIDNKPNWLHSKTIIDATDGLDHVIWWNIPKPPKRYSSISDIIQNETPFHDDNKIKLNLEMIPLSHREALQKAIAQGQTVFPGYKRARKGKQVLEIRTDGISGCLRTANGGSSRQYLVISNNGNLYTRLITVREAARLMGVPDTYKIPGNYNSGYNAMGDAVALPVTKYLTENLLLPLARRTYMTMIQDQLKIFKTTNKINSNGSLAVMLVITREAIEKGLPLNTQLLKTEKHGQVKGLSKESVQKVLKDYGIDQVLAQEGGRTSRGSMALMENYVALLNELSSSSNINLKIIETWWVDQVKEFLIGKPFKLHADSSKSIAFVIHDLIEQAEDRQKDSPGTMFVGALMQHLVGAKLTLILPDKIVKNCGFSVADEANIRSGDFNLDDVVIHVTATPTEKLLQKCRDNLNANLKPIIVTTASGVISGQNLAKHVGIEGRIDLFDIEQFIATNIYELSKFSRGNREPKVRLLIETYNQIVKECETDYSMLQIKIG